MINSLVDIFIIEIVFPTSLLVKVTIPNIDPNIFFNEIATNDDVYQDS